MGAHRRLAVLGFAVLGAIGVLAGAAAATGAAGSGPTGSSSTTTTAPSSVGIGGGLSFRRAVVTGPGLRTPRRMSAYQAAVFVQSWIADIYYGHPERRSPPAGVPVYRVDITGDWAGTDATLAAYYAADASTVWIAFPRQDITSTPSTSPPKPAGWIVALPRVRKAFAGTAVLQQTGGVAGATTPTRAAAASTTTSPAEGSRGSGRGSSRAGWIWAAVGLAVVAGGALAATARRRSGSRSR